MLWRIRRARRARLIGFLLQQARFEAGLRRKGALRDLRQTRTGARRPLGARGLAVSPAVSPYDTAALSAVSQDDAENGGEDAGESSRQTQRGARSGKSRRRQSEEGTAEEGSAS